MAGPNTAAGDKLPDSELGDLGNPEPVSGLGGGARYLTLTGTVEFPAGSRFCSVQVVDLVTSGAASRPRSSWPDWSAAGSDYPLARYVILEGWTTCR